MAETRNYVTDLPDEIKAEKKELLKQMALRGNVGLSAVEKAAQEADERTARAQRANFDRGAAIGAPDATRAALDEGRAALLGGFDQSRGMLGTDHSQELDRITAANIAYMDQLDAASILHKQRMDNQIEALRLAAAGRAGGGGGGGGRGGGGGSGGGLPPEFDTEVDDGSGIGFGTLLKGTRDAYMAAMANGESFTKTRAELYNHLTQNLGVQADNAWEIVDGIGKKVASDAGTPFFTGSRPVAAGARPATSTINGQPVRPRVETRPSGLTFPSGTINGQPVQGRIVPTPSGISAALARKRSTSSPKTRTNRTTARFF